MNRISIFILADLIMVSCVSNDEIISQASPLSFENESLGFVVSRTIPDDNFGVFSICTGDRKWDQGAGHEPVFLDNALAVRMQGSENEYVTSDFSGGKPDGATSYFAYSPYVEGAQWNGGVRYVVSGDVSDSNDLLYARTLDNDGGASIVGLSFRHALARLSVKLRSLTNDYGHTVRVKSIRLGDVNEGEHFYTEGTFSLADGCMWTDTRTDSANPLTISLDSSRFNITASALKADYTNILADDFIKVIPQDFTSVGLPVQIDFSIMDGESVILNDRLSCRVEADLRQGEICSLCFDLTPVPITFNPVVDPWIEETEGD